MGKRIALRFFPELEELCDDDVLVEFSNLEPVLPGVYKRDNFLLFASTFFRRNCCLGNSLNIDFLRSFQALSSELPNLRLKIHLDFDLIGFVGTEKEEFEYSYWWGPKFTDDIENIPKGVTHYINDNYDNLFSNLAVTKFGWYYQDNQKTLEIEEVVDKTNILEENQSLIGCRYIHSFISNNSHLPVHLDGVIRAYTEDKMILRLETPLNKTNRDTRYTKLWRIDGNIPP